MFAMKWTWDSLARGRGLLLSIVFLALAALSLYHGSWTRPPLYLAPGEIRPVVEREAARYGLNPDFVMAVVAAESSFNARASNQRARGLMQLTPPAWETVTDQPFREAWDWKTNVEAGTAYLGHLKAWLERRERFSYPVLAACYRHGPGRVAEAGFDISRLPPTRNEVYRQLDQGKIPKF